MRPKNPQQHPDIDWSLVAMGVTMVVSILFLISQLA